ncbi:MAG: T9SS type A sorting domain-containing protein [Fibrobacteres bacterium]|nr:T9SS type A sorting domain-containing protein [Fibrobacterota bacterium]
MSYKIKLNAFFLIASLTASVLAIDIPLNIKEYNGVARTNEPVATGVPLPLSAYKSTRYFQVTDANGTVVPTQIHMLDKWHDGSIKWMLVQFPASVSANGETVYHLRDNGAGQASGSMITETATHMFINTGSVIIGLKKSGGSNLFDFVIMNGDTLVSPSTKNGAVLKDNVSGTEYFSATAGGGFKAPEILENGAVRAVIKVQAFHSNNSTDHTFLASQFLIHVYKNESMVYVQHTLKNSPFARARGAIAFKDMSLNVKMNLTGSRNYTLFGKASVTGTLASGEEVYALQEKSAYKIMKGSSVVDTGARGLIWADVSGSNYGLAVGTRYSVANYPKEASVSYDGVVKVGLFPERGHKKLAGPINENYNSCDPEYYNTYYYLGDKEHKTHDVCFYFHTGSETAAKIENKLNAFNHKLFPTCEREWYARTRGFQSDWCPKAVNTAKPNLPIVDAPIKYGPISAAFGSPNYIEGWAWFGAQTSYGMLNDEIWDDCWQNYLDSMSPTYFRFCEARTYNDMDLIPAHMDDFRGLDHFKDHMGTKTTSSAFPNLTWYDYWTTYRTGKTKDSIHGVDIPIVKTSKQVGCQHANGDVDPEHFDVYELVDYYLLTGSYRAKEAYLDIANNYAGPIAVVLRRRTFPSADTIGLQYARLEGAALHFLMGCVTVTAAQDTYYTNAAKELCHDHICRVQKNNGSLGRETNLWLEGMAGTGLVTYLERFPNDSLVLAAIRKNIKHYHDWMMDTLTGYMSYTYPTAPVSGTNGNVSTMSVATSSCVYFLCNSYKWLGSEVSWLDAPLQNLWDKRFSGGSGDQNRILSLRYYVKYKADYLKNPMVNVTYDTTTSVEKSVDVAADPNISIVPNPFNPTTKITVVGIGTVMPEVKIFDISGKLVKAFNSRIAGSQHTYIWNAATNNSGTYFVKVSAGRNVLYKKVILLK